MFGVAVLAAIFSANGDYGTPAAYVAGLQPAIAVGAVVVGIGTIAALFIPARAGARALVAKHDEGVPPAVPRWANPPRHVSGAAGYVTRRSRTLPACRLSSAT